MEHLYYIKKSKNGIENYYYSFQLEEGGWLTNEEFTLLYLIEKYFKK